MLPRHALGIHYTRWYNFDNADIAKVVDDHASRALPLDNIVFDMDWHMKNSWTGSQPHIATYRFYRFT